MVAVPPVRTCSHWWPVIPRVMAPGTPSFMEIPSVRSAGTIASAVHIPVITPLPSFPPHDIAIPVTVAFPTPPVLLYLPVGNPAVSWGNITIVVAGQVHDIPGHTVRRNIPPRAIIGRGPEPVTVMGTIPGASEKEDVHGHIGHDIDVGSGYDHDRRWSRNTKEGGQGYIQANVYVCICPAGEKGQK